MSKVTKFMTDYLLYVAIILMSMSVVSGISQYRRQQNWDPVNARLVQEYQHSAYLYEGEYKGEEVQFLGTVRKPEMSYAVNPKNVMEYGVVYNTVDVVCLVAEVAFVVAAIGTDVTIKVMKHRVRKRCLV